MVTLLLDPVILLFFILFGLTWLVYHRGDRQIFILSSCILLLFILLASPMLANGLTFILEGSESPITCKSITPNAIIVLGGGIQSTVKEKDEIEHMHIATFRRTQKALKLAQKKPHLKIIVSGGAGTIKVTEADLMSRLLQQQGINSKRIIKERKSSSTWESSVNTGLLLKELNIKTIYLVTSAIHMPRALQSYRKQDLDVCAYPVDRMLIKPKWYEMLIPQISALLKTKNAIHEIVGIFWYYISN